jgi:hypothetical protein
MGKESERADAFAKEVAHLYGEEVRSIVLYGSAARDQYHEGVSDLNILVLLRRLDAALMRRGSGLARGWVQEGNPPPLILTEEELARSLDIFAIEYSDIRDAHRVLHGDDPFAGLQIRREDLRLQCERELKGALIQLRERYLLAADEPDELDILLRRSMSTFLVLFRTVLRLTGDAVPRDAGEVVEATAARVGFEAGPLLAILDARRSGSALRPAADDPRVAAYLAAVDLTVRFVDRLPVAG